MDHHPKPVLIHAGRPVGDALMACVSGKGYDWRSDLDVFGIETGVKITLDLSPDSDKVWTYSNGRD